MAFDALAFFRSIGIEPKTEGHKHTQVGWANVVCPFCTGNPGYHLGFHLESGAWKCWRCGNHGLYSVLSAFLGYDKKRIQEALDKFKGRPTAKTEDERKARGRSHSLNLPSGTKDLTPEHRAYLRKRGYQVGKLVRNWDLKSTGPIGPYKHRIVAPITFQKKIVSYTCRDVTGKSGIKFKSCKLEEEVVYHKSILYGIDMLPYRTGVIVEGPPDVWRLGPGAVATFGIEFTPEQVMCAAIHLDLAYIFYDPEKQARTQAEKLALALSALGVEVEILNAPDGHPDPGDMPQDEADDLMLDLFSSVM